MDLFIDATPAIVEVLCQRDIFDFIPANANPQAQPAAAQKIDPGSLFGACLARNEAGSDDRGRYLSHDHAGSLLFRESLQWWNTVRQDKAFHVLYERERKQVEQAAANCTL